MHLICNGCSHTAGAELEYPRQGDCYEKAWGKHLADKLGATYHNLAMSGASNHRILRTTYDSLYKLIAEGVSAKDLFFVIMWPGTHRTEIHFDGKFDFNYDNKWLPLIVGNDDQYKKYFPKKLYEYYRAWAVFTTQEASLIEHYNAVLNLQNLFLRYKIKFLFINAVEIPCTEDFKYNPYTIHIKKHNYIGFDNRDEVYTTYARLNGQKISPHSIDSGFNSHYDEDTMKWYAQHLFDVIKEKDLL